MMMLNHNRARTAEQFADDERPRDHEDMEVGDDPALMLRYLPADAAEEDGPAVYTAVDESQAWQAQAQSSVAGGAEAGVAASQHGNDDEAQGEKEDEREDREGGPAQITAIDFDEDAELADQEPPSDADDEVVEL